MVAEERLMLEAAEEIGRLMDEQGVTKAELARRIGRTRGYVTQVLCGRRNMTLRTLARMTSALRTVVEIRIGSSGVPRGIHTCDESCVAALGVSETTKVAAEGSDV